MRSTVVGMLLTATLAAVAFLVTAPAPAAPAPPDEPLAAKVREAIDKGKAFLRRQAHADKWDGTTGNADRHYPPGGAVSLATLAMLTCGDTDDDKDAAQDGLKVLRDIKVQPKDRSWTYVVSLQTMVYARNGDPNDLDAIKANVDWLLGARLPNGYWSYLYRKGGDGDASNTQYAVMALHEAIRAEVDVPKRDLESIQDFYLRQQSKDGSWAYDDSEPPSITMTTAGLCGLLTTGMDLDEVYHKLNDDGSDPNCGTYAEDAHIARALRWIGDRFPTNPKNVEDAGRAFFDADLKVPFYGLYDLGRLGRLSGERFIGGHDWYRVGCQCLVNSQKENGSWSSDTFDGQEIVATSFALLFLAEGRTPVLMTKLAYGRRDDDDWHHKHNDLRNVVEYASRALFKKQPMAWQNFDIRDLDAGTPAAAHDLAGQLLESPIVCLSGHDGGVTGDQEDLLNEYLENGGFVFAEACCGENNHPKGFGPKFRDLMKRIYPKADLKLLDDTHPIYSASGHASSAKDFPLYGIERGDKTVVVYSPNALSGYWEANDTTSDKGKKAFLLADNIIAYATGLKPPRPRLETPAP